MLANPRNDKQTRFLAVTLVVVLFVLFVGLFTAWYAHRELDILRRNGHQKLNLYAKVLGNELRRHEYLPLAMSQNRDILDLLSHQTDFEQQRRLNRYLEKVNDQTDASAIYLMNLEGLTVASSNWRSQDSYVGNNYSFRPYFQMSRNGQPGHYFAIGATTKTPGLFLSYPVIFAGQPLGVVAIKVSMTPLEQAWASQGSEKVFLTDDPGVIFASNEPAWKFRTLVPLEEETLGLLRKSRKYLELDLPALGLEPLPWTDGIADLVSIPSPEPTYYLKQQAPLSGTPWTLHICSDLRPVVAKMGAVLTISFLSGLSGLLLLLDIIDHRHHRQERKRYQLNARKKLKIRAAERRAIISHTRAALVIVTPEGRIESFNPTAERYFGYIEDELKGQRLVQLLDSEGQQALEGSLFSSNGQSGNECQIETHARRKNGSQFPIDLIANEINLHRGCRYIITIHDISSLKAAEIKLRNALEEQEQRVHERTAELRSANQRLLSEISERKLAEKVLKDTQDDLLQTSKLAALGQMSAGVVHELNQPLTAIGNFTASSKLLLEQNRLGQVRENLVRIVALTEHMAKISSQLKIFARKSGGERKLISLRIALDRVLALFEERIRLEKVRVRLDLPADPLLVEGDSLRLEQVLINLIGNALDAMDETKQPQIIIEAILGPAGLRLGICDNGSGIAGDHMTRLFDPFFTTKEVGKGLGLGLSISYGIIKDWGGTIRGNNRPGGGAEFIIELPGTGKGQTNG